MQIVWSVKGGVGVTVVAASLAAGWARRDGGAVLVDLCGDAPAVLGVPEPSGPGVRDWLAAPDTAPGALARLVVPVADGLSLLPRGASTAGRTTSRVAELADELLALGGHVVVDAGRRDAAPEVADDDLVAALCRRGRSLMVTRPCYLALRRAVSAGATADGVVLVTEPGRCLDRRDVTDVLSLPVLAEVELDPAVARSVDAGLLTRRSHRVLERSLRELW